MTSNYREKTLDIPHTAAYIINRHRAESKNACDTEETAIKESSEVEFPIRTAYAAVTIHGVCFLPFIPYNELGKYTCA